MKKNPHDAKFSRWLRKHLKRNYRVRRVMPLSAGHFALTALAVGAYKLYSVTMTQRKKKKTNRRRHRGHILKGCNTYKYTPERWN